MLSRLFAKINVPKAAWVMIAVGTALRIFQMVDNPLQVDEAESSINGLTILQHGVPIESYLGEPIFENTLTDPWPENEEYEFKDSSYSPKGLAVYHAWLPLYSIAAAEWIFGIEPDAVQENPQILHGADSVLKRTVVPRLPSILFSVGFMLASFMAARKLAGSAAGWAALTWTSIGTRAISNGHQARYYSLTLLMNAVFAIVYFRACRRGRMRDFCILGVAEGLLFHTHQLSAVVAAAVAACGLKQISRHPNWLQKCTVSGLIALTIILPWALLSGFFDTASSVPKAYVLFHGWQDWFRYLATQVTEIVLALGGLIAIILLKYNKTDKPLENASSLKSQSILLMSWCVCAFLAFHIFIPAASFFTERLTLMLITPYVLLVSAAIGILCQRFIPRFQVPASVLCMFTILFISNSHPKLVYKNALDKFALIIDTLDKKEFNPGTKFYAAPNYHLVWTYYTGVPVQSIAPIRKEFLDSYPAPIVYIESRPFHLQVHELSVQDYLRRNKI